MKTEVTVVTPCAEHHMGLLDICKKSVQGQTIPCTHLIGIDHAANGPGYVRNRLTTLAKTPYIVFLDADDYIEPTFVEETLKAIGDAAYAYTDWKEKDKYMHAPARGWCNGEHHLVTTLLRRDVFMHAGRFDESLTALEDTDFYLKLNTRLHCGVKVPQALVHYTNKGKRAKSAHDSGRVVKLKLELVKRYGGKMSCCGGYAASNEPVNSEEEGTILARALWSGNRRVRGNITGRIYPRMSFPKVGYIFPQDIAAMPGMWEKMTYDSGPSKEELHAAIEPDVLTVIELTAAAYE